MSLGANDRRRLIVLTLLLVSLIPHVALSVASMRRSQELRKRQAVVAAQLEELKSQLKTVERLNAETRASIEATERACGSQGRKL